MLTVKFFPADQKIGAAPFVAIETPACFPQGDDDPLLVDDLDEARKLLAELQAAIAKWEAK